MKFPNGMVVGVERASGFDADGNLKNPAQHQIGRCVRDRESSVETVDGIQSIVTRELLLCDDPAADVRGDDILVFPGGERWQVVGDVDRPLNPFVGWTPGCVIPIERAAGATQHQD